jgi:phospholipid/cholesterol/gamma-HCH transport system permease protein
MITREAVYTDAAGSVFVSLWRAIVLGLGEIGRAGTLSAQALCLMPLLLRTRRSRDELVRQLFATGIKSLALITIVGMFTGMILGLQTGLELRRYNQEIYIGSAVMVSLLREMGPFMTGIILAACVGSSMAAQIGTMTVNDEVAALEIMSISPVRFLMAPRMAAMIIMTPLLSFYTCVLGVIGGGIVGATQLSVPWSQYMANAMKMADSYDLYVGLLKAMVFGIVITGVSCFEGFTTTQGAVGVGQATRRSVILSILLILILGYIITRLFYDL